MRRIGERRRRSTLGLFLVMNRHGHVVDKRLSEIITKGDQVKVLSETLLDFRLQDQSLPARQ